MAKNQMEEVARLLGVGLGEEFRIKFCPNELFKFDMNGILFQRDGCHSWNSADTVILQNLMSGSFEIFKLPWKPKEGDGYWSYYADFDIDGGEWYGSAGDYIRLKCGCVFRTREEALAAKAAKYKELTGHDWDTENE